MIPSGAVSSRSVHNKKHCVVTYSEIINPGEEDVLRQYFTCLLAKYPDVLKVQDIIKITGLCDKKAVHLIKDGVIQSIAKQGGYLVPKAYLLEFVVSREFINIKSKSTVFKKVLDNFQFWYETRTSE